MNRFEEMESFVQVVRAQSLSSAAQRMGVAVSAISRRLRQLENRLGTQLLHRSTRSIGLTEAGREFFRHCERILGDLEEAESLLRCGQSALHGRLRIAAPVSFSNRHLAPAISIFMQRHPGISIDLDMNDRAVDLVAEGFDLAVRIGQLADSSLIARRIAPLSHVICASPDFLEQYGYPEHPQDIRDWPALCYGNLRHYDQWPYQYQHENGHLEQGVVQVQARLTASNGDFLLHAASQGLGILCEPKFIVHDAINQGVLTPVLTAYQWYEMALYLVYPSVRHKSARVRAFVEFLIQHFGASPYWEDASTVDSKNQ